MAKKKVKKGTMKSAKKSVRKSAKKGKKSAYDKMRQNMKNRGERRGAGPGFYRIPGDSRIQVRPFPFEEEDGPTLFVERLVHWGLDPDDRSVNILCPESYGEECPICELREDMPDKLWGKVRPQRRFLMNAVVRKGEDGKDVQKIVELASTAHDQLEDLLVELGETSDPLDFKRGRDFKIVRRGKGFNDTKYTVTAKETKTAIGMDVKPVDLSRFVRPPSEEDMDNATAMIQERM